MGFQTAVAKDRELPVPAGAGGGTVIIFRILMHILVS
jgi:hypothetical protein